VATETGRSSAVDQLLEVRGLSRRVVARASSFVSAQMIVANTPGLVITLQKQIAEWVLEDTQMILHPHPLPLPKLTIGMLWNRRMDSDAGHRWLREALQTIMEAGARETAAAG
ncbi:MAG: hypothetical protein AAGC55_31685, partial [Myxococcota bacterium]